MAIGDSTNKIYEPSYYSRFQIKNSESKRISITYNSGLMKLEISKSTGSGAEYKSETEEAIFLSPMKAHLLVNEIDRFLEYRKSGDIDPNKAFGVNAGMGEKVTYIAFSASDEAAIKLTIGKFDGNGVVTESAEFNFSVDFNYSLEWENLSSNDITKVVDNNIEIVMLRNAIEDFSRSMNGAYGYAVHDIGRYDANRMNRRVDQIFDKLGIDRANYSNGNRNYSNNNNFLNNAAPKTVSYEDVEDLLN